MTQNQNTISRHYQQLNFGERGQIMALLHENKSIRQIATIIGRNPSTISREVRRGTTSQVGPNHQVYQAYFAETGQANYLKNQTNSHQLSWLVKAPEFFKQLAKELTRKYRIHSVDSFVHWFKQHHPDLPCPSTPTVYRYIDQGLPELSNSNLPMKLRRRIKKPGLKHQPMNKRVLGQSIEERPIEATNRAEVGHWEGDLVKGKRLASEPAIMTLTDRLSRYEIIVKIDNYHADTCRDALQNVIADYGSEYFKSITFDNGSEFALLSEIKDTQIYFAHPYSPWERGSNENQNQLIREFIPKGKSMKDLSIIKIQAVQDALNQRPRRILNYQSAAELMPDFD